MYKKVHIIFSERYDLEPRPRFRVIETVALLSSTVLCYYHKLLHASKTEDKLQVSQEQLMTKTQPKSRPWPHGGVSSKQA